MSKSNSRPVRTNSLLQKTGTYINNSHTQAFDGKCFHQVIKSIQYSLGEGETNWK